MKVEAAQVDMHSKDEHVNVKAEPGGTILPVWVAVKELGVKLPQYGP